MGSEFFDKYFTIGWQKYELMQEAKKYDSIKEVLEKCLLGEKDSFVECIIVKVNESEYIMDVLNLGLDIIEEMKNKIKEYEIVVDWV